MKTTHSTSAVLRFLLDALRAVSFLSTAVVGAVSMMLVISMLLGTRFYIVQSDSMKPMMEAGDLAAVDTTRCLPEVGDVIAYHIEGSDPAGEENSMADVREYGNAGAAGSRMAEVVVTHRVISVSTGKQNVYQTRGDANRTPDSLPVRQEQIAGTVIGVIPLAGFVFDRLQRGGVAALILVIIGINLLSICVDRLAVPGMRINEKGGPSEYGIRNEKRKQKNTLNCAVLPARGGTDSGRRHGISV